MPSVERKLQANESKASRFDFDRIVGSYDSWYASRRDAMYDRLEKELSFTLQRLDCADLAIC